MQPFWISLLLASSAAATPLANAVAERGLSSYDEASAEPVKAQLEARDDDLWYRTECWDSSEWSSAGSWGSFTPIFRYNTWLTKATCERSGWNYHTSGSCIRDSGTGNAWIDGPQWWNDCKAVASGGYKDYRRSSSDPNKYEEYTRTIPSDQVEGRGFDKAHNAPGK